MKNKNDTKFMKEALHLALKAEGFTSPNPLVGAVVVKGNKIVGKGYHKKAGSPHAEIIAIKSAGRKANRATLYINLEPCVHYGRTPPCVPEIIKAGIKRIVIAMKDPNPLVNGKGIKKLESEGIDIQVGILEQDAEKINESYIKYITKKMPFVVLKWAMSLDGKIATRTGNSKWISHQKSRDFTHRLRGKFDAVLIGIGTLLKDNPQLTTHGLGVKEPKRIIVDAKGEIPTDCNLLKTEGLPANASPPAAKRAGVAGGQVIIATTNKINKEKKEGLKKKGAEIIIVASENPAPQNASPFMARMTASMRSGVNLKELMIELANREITSILVEGGGTINASFIENGLADKFIAFISPIIIGGKNAISPIEGKGIEKISDAIKIRDFSVRKLGEDIVVEGYIK